MKPLLILQTGSTYPALQRHYGDFPDCIRQGLGDRTPVTVVDARESEFLPGAAGFSGVVITGSHHMVTETLPDPVGEIAVMPLQGGVGATGLQNQ